MKNRNHEPQKPPRFDMIAFDADDTLWHNESLFHLTQDKFTDLLTDYHGAQWIKEKLYQTEMKNLSYFGYGVKGFTLSMIETAIELTEGRISGHKIQKIIQYAREMVKAPVDLLPHVADTIRTLAQTYPLMVITKGDLFDQESKVARSGLADYFQHVEILSAKNADTYRKVLQKHEISPQRFMMVGNSLKSDVLPVLEIDGHAVFVPYHLCWEHEKADETELNGKTFSQLENIGGLPSLIRELSNH